MGYFGLSGFLTALPTTLCCGYRGRSASLLTWREVASLATRIFTSCHLPKPTLRCYGVRPGSCLERLWAWPSYSGPAVLTGQTARLPPPFFWSASLSYPSWDSRSGTSPSFSRFSGFALWFSCAELMRPSGCATCFLFWLLL